MCAGDLHEISGICTHPDFQGRGLAKKLTLKLVQRQLRRGKTPFLHVMADNAPARALYAAKFTFLGALAQAPAALREAFARVSWYEVTLTQGRLVDNTRGFGHRDEFVFD